MIVNDLENKKTIDQDTGTYLTLKLQRANEEIEIFVINEDGKEVDFTSIRSFVATDNGVDIVRNVIQSSYLRNYPEETTRYANFFEEFISVYGWCYGMRERSFNRAIVKFHDLNKY